ncbi:MAG: LacI family DNA-binding transcriptional regulator [Lentisphaeria bacterium]|nr:LacI family DNA-binding transcriptional regulator [Lentisphaeria bacterium]
MAKSISIVDVAKHAGVSVSTVSLVMNNRPNVSPETAEAVWCSVKALGYRPGGPSGRKRGPKPGPRQPVRNPQILVLQTGFPAAHFSGDIWTALLHGILEALAGRDAALQLLRVQDEDEACDSVRRLSPQGVLLVGTVRPGPLGELLKRIPCVQALGDPSHEEPWDCVTCHAAGIGRLAARWLSERGRTRCVAVTSGNGFVGDAVLPFQGALEGAGGTVEHVPSGEALSWDGIFPVLRLSRARVLFQECLTKAGNPTGFFLDSELLACGLCRFCSDCGLELGRDMDAVCTSVRAPLSPAPQKFPAVIGIHPEQIGMQAVDQILWRMEHRYEPHMTRLVSPSLLEAL